MKGRGPLKMRKRISFLLLLTFLMTTFAPVYASTNCKDDGNRHLTELFYEASDDEIVAYYEGQPIRKEI